MSIGDPNDGGTLTPEQIASRLGLPPPTEEQAAVIAAPLEPGVVIAGAGSGKTETMAARVVWLVANGLVRPEQVLGLTFTRKAARELATRIRRRLGQLVARDVIDPADGSVRYQGAYEGSVTFAADTSVDGRPALVWQYGNTVQALLDGESRPIEYELPPDARLSSAGTSVLIREGNALSTLGTDGLVTVPTPAPGSTPMALDDGELISASFEGPVQRTDIETGDETEVELENPGDGLEIKAWKSAGHGLAVSVWGDPGASTNSGHRLQLVIHSLEDGAVTSINEVSSADIGEAGWTRGQGYSLASIGPYLYDLDTGLLVLDGTDSGMQFGVPRGDLVPGTMDGEPVIAAGLLSDAPTAYSTNADLLAVTDDGRFAITRTGADRITAYPAA